MFGRELDSIRHLSGLNLWGLVHFGGGIDWILDVVVQKLHSSSEGRPRTTTTTTAQPPPLLGLLLLLLLLILPLLTSATDLLPLPSCYCQFYSQPPTNYKCCRSPHVSQGLFVPG